MNYLYRILVIVWFSGVMAHPAYTHEIKGKGKKTESAKRSNSKVAAPIPAPPPSVAPAPLKAMPFEQQMADMNAALEALNERIVRTVNTAAPDLMNNLPVVVTDEVAEDRAKAGKVFSYLDQNPDKIVEAVTPESLLTLPIGLTKTLGDNSRVTVGILEAKFEKAVTKLTIFVRLNYHVSGSTEPNRDLFLGAQDVSFTRDGGISGFTAALLGDYVLPMKQWTVILKGSTSTTFNCTGCAGTTATFNCGQFDTGALCAEVVFPTTVLKPYNLTTRKAEEGRVGLTFSRTFNAAGGLRDIYADACFSTPFCVAGFEKFGFTASGVTYDESDTQSPTDPKVFPEGYVGETGPLWTGIAIRNFAVHLPKAFKKHNNENELSSLPTAGVSAGGRGILIDRTGFTGAVFYETTSAAAAADAYSAKRWKMSLERLELRFLQNRFLGGSFGGGISVPLVDYNCGGNLVGYNATIDVTGQYALSVKALSNITYDIKALRAQGTFYAGSHVMLEYVEENDDERFYPSADLSGELTINTKVDNLTSANHCDNWETVEQTARFEGIRFQNLIFQTRGSGPRFQVGYFEYQGSEKSRVAGFPVSVTRLAKFEGLLNGVPPGANQFWIDLAFKVSLAQDRIAGSTNLVIKTQYDEANGLLKFDGLNLRRLDVKASTTAFDMRGYVEVYEDGNEKGFKGAIKAVVKTPMVFGVEAKAQFGYWKGTNTSNGGVYGNVVCEPAGQAFRYGYLDFYAGKMYQVSGTDANGDATLIEKGNSTGTGTIASAIPTGIGDLAINGAGMGVYFNMRPRFNNDADPTQVMVYEPCYQVPFGFKVMLGFQRGLLDNPPMHGRVNLDIALDRKYGINSMSMYGNAVFTSSFVSNLNSYAKKALGGVVEGASPEELGNINENTALISQVLLNAKAEALNAKKAVLTSTASDDFSKEGNIVMTAGLMIDIPNKTLHVEAGAYINQVDDQGNGLRGIGPNGRVGKVVLHMAPGVFYLHAGYPTPYSSRLGIRYDYISGGTSAHADVSAYLMIGQGVPDFPAPPERVIRYLGLQPSQYQKTALQYSDLRDGKAFALGASASLDVSLKLTKKYFVIGEADAGMDLLLTNDASCPGTSLQPGTWFGRGQVFCYTAARVVNTNKNKNVASFDFGMLLQGNGLKPFGVGGDVCISVCRQLKVDRSC